LNRRDLVKMTAATCALWACGGPVGAAEFKSTRADAVDLTPEKWREILTPQEYSVLRDAGTERAFTGDLWDDHEDAVFVCAGCGLPLFDSKAKFDSGTGWPSFWEPIAKDAVADRVDTSLGVVRTESLCARCGGHLGHVFRDGPKPTFLRYCINSVSLDKVPRAQASGLGAVQLGGVGGSTP
jgi:peptide-methionine (R)-S-oxide reductase